MPQTKSPPRPSYSREAPEKRRQELIEATFRCLARNGIANTSVRAIAEEAGMSIGMIRHHFEEKQHLIAATYRYVSNRVYDRAEAAGQSSNGGTREQLRAFMTAGVEPPFLDRDYLLVRFILWGVAMTDPVVRAVHDERYGQFRTRLSQYIGATLESHPEKVNLQTLTLTVSALLDGLWIDWLLRPDECDLYGSIDHCLSMIEAFDVSAKTESAV